MDVSKRKQRLPVSAQIVTTTTTQRPFKRPRQESFAKQIGAVASDTAPEKKNFDLTSTLTAPAASVFTAVTLINGIAQGTTANQRIGRRLNIKSILVRWETLQNLLRFVVVYDHAPNGVLPAVTDILTVNEITGVNNLINNDRFMILHDEMIQTVGNAGAIGKWFYKRQPLQNQWTNAATGTIADITTGAIYVMFCGPTTVTGSARFTSRVRFTDM